MSEIAIATEEMTQLFLRLRQRGYRLGMDEYRAGLQALETGYGANEQTFLATIEILWCHNRSQQNQIATEWEEVKKLKPKLNDRDDRDPSNRKRSDLDELPEYNPQFDRVEPEQNFQESAPQPKSEIATLPILSPLFNPIDRDDLLSLESYFPLSRRSMIYGWRFLRRMVADGCLDVVDIPATIQAVSDRGYYLAPVYRRRERNAARLLLLIDRNGSMMPFHRFTRDLVETAQGESPLAPENVMVFYFHNVLGSHLYGDLYLTEPILTADILEQCDRDTSVLIVSDAGAARGYRRQERIQTTTRFLLRLRRYTNLVAWLNPMRQQRWAGSSAEILAYLVSMRQMDRQGFGEAIEIVRGLTAADGGEL